MNTHHAKMQEILDNTKLNSESRNAINTLSAAVEKRLAEMSEAEKNEAILKIVLDFASNALIGDEGYDDGTYARCRDRWQILEKMGLGPAAK